MVRFVIDEDMPRSTARVFRGLGFEAFDIRDHGLRGKSDREIFQFTQNQGAILVTADWGFANIIDFPPGTHSGIVIVHLPNALSVEELNKQISVSIKDLHPDDFSGNLIIIEPGRIRMRRRS